MVYQQVFVTSILDIPEQVGIFANANGWSVNNVNPSQPILTHPSLVGALPMRFRAAISGANNQNHDLIIESTSPVATNNALTRSPKLAGAANNPTVPTPSSVHLFTDTSGEPFIAGVIEYGPNQFRHFYFGYMHKNHAYTGGECISGSGGPDSSTTANIAYFSATAGKYLLSAKQNVFTAAQSGGIHCAHAANPTPWRQNIGPASPTGNVFAAFTNAQVVGSYRDGMNDPFLPRGQSSFAGAVVLIPINMYAASPITADTVFVPLGNPAGVRMVNMQNLSIGQDVEIGGVEWKCFPAMSKRAEVDMPIGGGNYRQFETSFNVGFAYRKN